MISFMGTLSTGIGRISKKFVLNDGKPFFGLLVSKADFSHSL